MNLFKAVDKSEYRDFSFGLEDFHTKLEQTNKAFSDFVSIGADPLGINMAIEPEDKTSIKERWNGENDTNDSNQPIEGIELGSDQEHETYVEPLKPDE